ncbi:MAG: hypothetical protein ACR2PL_02045 [Dehalococcoidia bacterium]
MSEYQNGIAKNASARLYDAVVGLYPRRFRQEYGSLMKQVFRDLLHDPDTPTWRLWLTVFADLPGSLLSEHVSNFREEGAMDLKRLINTPVVRRGVAFGLITGLVWTIYNVVNNAMNLDARGNALLNNGLTIALVLLFGGAGFTGARQGRSIRAGTFAGLSTAVVSTVIGIVGLWIAVFVFFDNARHNTFMIEDFRRSHSQSMDAFIIDDALGATFFGSLLALALGTSIGTVGGLFARWARLIWPIQNEKR